MRGVGPTALPAEWTKGHRHAYRIDAVLSWLAARRGERLDLLATWRSCLLTKFDTDVSDAEEVRKWAHVYARAAGPIVGDVTFTPTGFHAYLASLLSSQ